jgi:predicted aspartyl protease
MQQALTDLQKEVKGVLVLPSSFRAETNHVSLHPTAITCHISSGTKPGNVSIKAKVNGVITNLLIDTGATVTLISTGFIKDMSNMPD